MNPFLAAHTFPCFPIQPLLFQRPLSTNQAPKSHFLPRLDLCASSKIPMMADRPSNEFKPSSGDLDGDEMVVMGLVLSQKSGLELMQNCDLPPPAKVFAGPDKAVVSPTNRAYAAVEVQEDENYEIGVLRSGGENGKLELMKALRRSQTRAREAEKAAAVLAKERDQLRNAFWEESSRLFAYRQWVKLLELQLKKLQRQQRQFRGGDCHRSWKEEDDEDAGGVTWLVAWAVGLGIAGVGFAFGCRYFF